MRKAINVSALLFFIWLVLDALALPSTLIHFLLFGIIPGTSIKLSPSLMLALMTAIAGVVVFELIAHRIEMIWRVRQQIITITTRRARLPRRRFSRI